MTITIIHRFEFPTGMFPWVTHKDLVDLENRIMSALSDKIAAATASADAEIGRVQSAVAALTAKVAELQALVDAGTATPADLQALDDLKAKLDALDPTQPATLPPTP